MKTRLLQTLTLVMLSFAAIAQCTSTLTGPNLEYAPAAGSFLPDAIVSQPYETTIEIFVPSRAKIGTDSIDVAYFKVVNLLGDPPYTAYTTTPANGYLFPGNACLHLSVPSISDLVDTNELVIVYTIFGTDTSGDTLSGTYNYGVSHYIDIIYGTPRAEAYVNGSRSICVGDQLIFWPLYDYASANYSWSAPGATLLGTSSRRDTFQFNTAGVYDVILTASDVGTAYDTVTVTVSDYPTVSISPVGLSASCGGSAVLAYSSGGSLEVDNPQAGYTYQWYQSGSAVPGANGTSYTPNQPNGEITVWAENNGCGLLASGYTLTDSLLFDIEICLVTVDSATNKNQLIWEKNTAATCLDSVRVWRESNVTNVYDLIATVAYNDFSTYIDTGSAPEQRSDKYRLSLNGSGIESSMSDPHKTIHLTINSGQGNAFNLIWNSYEGAPVSTYNIYRGTNPGNLALYASVSGSNTSYTDINPNGTANIYQIEVVLPYTCNPSKTGQAYTRSNKFDATDLLSGIDEAKLLEHVTIAPNPTSGLVTIKVDQLEVQSVKLFSIQGAEVFNAGGFEQGAQKTLDVSELGTGLYIVQIQLADGNVLNTKVLVD